MKIDLNLKKNSPASSLRAKLLGVFIIFSLALLGFLWLMQSVLLEKYYELSMERKCRNGVSSISQAYSTDEEMDFDSFLRLIGDVAEKSDIYIYLETEDGQYSLSSSDIAKTGRIMPESTRILSDARKMLLSSYTDEVSYTVAGMRDDKMVVFAKKVVSKSRGNVYLYAMAFLTPLGPAVGILRSQLVIVSLIVLALGIAVSFITSKRLAAPLAQMSRDAKRLGEGDFDVRFEGSGYSEVSELAGTLNDAAAELKKTDALRKDLMANVSHDLRTPLTMIKSYAEMIRDISGENKEKREEHLGVIIEETDRLSKLVDEMMLLSRVQAGTEEFDEKPFDLQKAAEEIIQTYRIMEQEGYTISFERMDEDIQVFGDEGRIKQVISNLMSNAVKYSDERKEIKLSFEKDGEYIKLKVEDKGIGIAEDQLDRIWSRYQRASQKGVRSKDGSGLGLSICSEILKRSNAEYGVESALGEGSCFWFRMKML